MKSKIGLHVERAESRRNSMSVRKDYVHFKIQSDASLEQMALILKLASDRIYHYIATEKEDVYRTSLKLDKEEDGVQI